MTDDQKASVRRLVEVVTQVASAILVKQQPTTSHRQSHHPALAKGLSLETLAFAEL